MRVRVPWIVLCALGFLLSAPPPSRATPRFTQQAATADGGQLLLRLLVPSPLKGLDRFVRVSLCRNSDGLYGCRLETAVHTLRNPKTGKVVVLIGTCHEARRGYWRRIEQDAASADLVCLEGKNDDHFTPIESSDWARGIYRDAIDTTRYLGLTYQSDWDMGLHGPRWEHLDIPLRTLDGMIRKKHPTAPPATKRQMSRIEKWLALGDKDPDRQAHEDTLYYELLAMASSARVRDLDDAFVRQRDAVVLEGVRGALRKKEIRRVALVYGADHAWDLEPHLLKEDGFKLVDVSWHDALVHFFPESDGVKRGAAASQETVHTTTAKGVDVTTKAPSGSKTKIIASPNGTKTVVTVSPDGTTTTTTASSSGAATTTVTASDGTMSTVAASPSGAVMTTTTARDGTMTSVAAPTNGAVRTTTISPKSKMTSTLHAATGAAGKTTSGG